MHVVLRALSMDSAACSDAYVFGWADGDMDLVNKHAETVPRVPRQILADLTPHDGPADKLDPARVRIDRCGGRARGSVMDTLADAPFAG